MISLKHLFFFVLVATGAWAADFEEEDGVIVLETDNFQEAIDSNELILVEFYAPWCGHCKKLAPIYDELGEKFEGVDSVMIAKMDATANEIDHDGVNVKGFPTIIYFPGSDKSNPVTYQGARDLDGFVEFLSEKATKPFELSDGTKSAKASVAEEL
uniref:protein disulfide-isomerase n=1 Tax=Fibrocapsa japonica TaxID=94617 RepID=A0A6U1MBH6_9STRA|mmetsp:Transcript_14706/g.21641  ORF Transcript_14706/g.21641 Transcript_14706/m.21641 type:complete len:156 (+) Transcript_14706:260-727(+)